MIAAAFSLGLLGMFVWQATDAPDIAGNWSGEAWGQVVLKNTGEGEYSGTYSNTLTENPGTIEVKWSRVERRYKGAWREGKERSGNISLRLVDDEIRGAWTTSKKSVPRPGTPELADLTWKPHSGTPSSSPSETRTTKMQIRIAGPDGMEVAVADEQGQFDNSPTLKVPAKLNLDFGRIYRLKLTNIHGRDGVESYPTLETGPTMPRTAAYLAHNSISVRFTEEDFDQALAGSFLTKVIYLPDPDLQELVVADAEILASSRIEPGKDPITEADRRGLILAVIRLGNKDMERRSRVEERKGATSARSNAHESTKNKEGVREPDPENDKGSALSKGLKFLAPYKELRRLSLDMAFPKTSVRTQLRC